MYSTLSVKLYWLHMTSFGPYKGMILIIISCFFNIITFLLFIIIIIIIFKSCKFHKAKLKLHSFSG